MLSFTTAIIRSFRHFEHLELLLSLYCDVWHLLAVNSNLAGNFQPSSESTRCSGDKEKSINIRSEYASDFCHDRKSAFRDASFSENGDFRKKYGCGKWTLR